MAIEEVIDRAVMLQQTIIIEYCTRSGKVFVCEITDIEYSRYYGGGYILARRTDIDEDPNIDVIWGTATDDSLGEDAKVTILATGLEDDLRTEVEKDAHRDEDDFYEDLIPKLYKPNKKEKPTIKEAIVQELPFEVEVAPNPEPVTDVHTRETEGRADSETEDDREAGSPTQPSMLEKWKKWLNDLMKDVVE
jgi:cell division protein FtsZ